LGSGGNGDVYLARHTRLDKKVVLKADRRDISARPEVLRREVDVLKNLRHKNIPIVYDFFIEGNTVYTAMEYIKGESLDRPLARGERFPQRQVIVWARELLEALCYLHSPVHGDPPRGYVHSDIKPANLMRRPDGSICLIDFNITLAMGEESVVYGTPGYASPEHYGVRYDSSGKKDPVRRKVMPDIRSDIYSVGATLYHLISGRRPEAKAVLVEPLDASCATPPFIQMVKKAMNPYPDFRYQSAEEMLRDLGSLRERDPAAHRLRKMQYLLTAATAIFLAAGAALTAAGSQRMKTRKMWEQKAEEAQEELRLGNRLGAVALLENVMTGKKSPLSPGLPAICESAWAEATGCYHLTDGYESLRTVLLPSKPVRAAVSPEGTGIACICEWDLVVIDPETGEIRRSLPAMDSSWDDVVFLDEHTILFAGAEGITSYDPVSDTVRWTGRKATSIAVSEDGKTACALYRDEDHAVLYDTETGEERKVIDFYGRRQDVPQNDRFVDPGGHLFLMSESGDDLYVECSGGQVWRYDLTDAGRAPAEIRDGDLTEALKKKSRQRYADIPEDLAPEAHLQEENAAASVFAASPAAAAGGSTDSPLLRLYRFTEHKEAEILSYDPACLHMEARVLPGEDALCLFDIYEIHVFDKSGREVVSETLPDPESIYDQQFVRTGDGAYLEVTWYDGTRVRYDARTGEELARETVEIPDVSLYEEILTDSYRVVSELHLDPVVYSTASGKEVGRLREDAFLTYLTECGDVCAAQFLTSEGKQYGCIYNQDFEEIGRIPNLCDVDGRVLYVDDGAGSIRKTEMQSRNKWKRADEGEG
ncbi:MAG: protein kinase, partial [Lachnospiraceae bacterium]|nr:protein kinase [Lachnospiraceae bacterium]